MTVLPADTARTYSDEAKSSLRAFTCKDSESSAIRGVSSSESEPTLYQASGTVCQEGIKENPFTTLRIALVQGVVSFTDQCLSYLQNHNIQLQFVATPDAVLPRLERSPDHPQILAYPIWTQWQRALDFAREVRRIRERHGTPPYPRVLILSFVEQLPVTVQWFRQTNGTDYSVFTSQKNLVQTLRSIQGEIAKAQQLSRLHLRFVHSGNPSGSGCIPGEMLVAAYGAFSPGSEEEISESKNVLRFVNLLATSRWRFRNAPELLDLMIRHPLYQRKNGTSDVLSVGSIKTYIRRAEDVLSSFWYSSRTAVRMPTVIAREFRGHKEVAYRLLCTVEVEHI